MPKNATKQSNVTTGWKNPQYPLSVFAFGTGESSCMKEPNIITQFSSACHGSKMVVEGPTMLGTEVTPNAQEVVKNVLENIGAVAHDKPIVINLTGFSRGAITCIQIANEFKAQQVLLQSSDSRSDDDKKKLDFLKHLKLNIFAIDPVAGMGAKTTSESCVIPDNVENFTAIMQLDEMRREFKPQDLSRVIITDSTKTHVSWLPMYGNHSDSTKVKKDSMQHGPKIIWQCLHQFFTQHGTRFDEVRVPSLAVSKKANREQQDPAIPLTDPKELLKLYGGHHDEREAHLSYARRSKPLDSAMLRKPRRIKQQLELYVKDSDFFVNAMERQLFKIAYPRTFNYLFEKNMADPRMRQNSESSKEDVIAELNILKQENSGLFTRLTQKRGVPVTLDDPSTFGKPRGYASLEPCDTLAALYPDMLADSGFDVTVPMQTTLSELARLEQDVYRTTLQYEKEKPFYSTFDKRVDAPLAKQIREEVLAVLKDPNVAINVKQEAIIAMIQEHTTQLQLAKRQGELLDYLQPLLQRYGLKLNKQESVSPSRELCADFVIATSNLITTTLGFVGSLGYVGGYALSVVGQFMQDLGRRICECIGPVKHNPLKAMLWTAGMLIQGVGVALKNHLGLKPLTQLLVGAVQTWRDQCVMFIRKVDQNVSSQHHIKEEMQHEELLYKREHEQHLAKETNSFLPQPLSSNR